MHLSNGSFLLSPRIDQLSQVYLAITTFVWVLVVVFYFSSIPEVSDDDMQYQQEVNERTLRHDEKPFLKQHRLFLAVFAKFMYVSAEGIRPPALPHLTLVAVGAFYITYVEDVTGYSDSKASNLFSVAQGIFTLGRFMCTLAMRWVHAKYILATFISILVVIAALASNIDGTAAVVLYTLFLFER